MEFAVIAALLALVALAGLGCFLLAAAIAARIFFPPGEAEKRPGTEAAEGADARRKNDPMDEGFENIMAYSVMGKTGFGGGDGE